MCTALFIHIPEAFRYKVYCWGDTLKKKKIRDRGMDNLIKEVIVQYRKWTPLKTHVFCFPKISLHSPSVTQFTSICVQQFFSVFVNSWHFSLSSLSASLGRVAHENFLPEGRGILSLEMFIQSSTNWGRNHRHHQQWVTYTEQGNGMERGREQQDNDFPKLTSLKISRTPLRTRVFCFSKISLLGASVTQFTSICDSQAACSRLQQLLGTNRSWL